MAVEIGLSELVTDELGEISHSIVLSIVILRVIELI
jgi:hypothetical protein